MPQEFTTILAEFSRLVENYCDNALLVVPGPDHAQLVDIYRQGLTTATRNMASALTAHYERSGDEWRRQADTYVALSGVIPMAQRANQHIGKHSFHDGTALSEASGIFEKIKRVLADIPGILTLPLPFPGGVGKLLGLIDNFIDLIRKLFNSTPTTPSTPTVDNTYKPYTLKPCEWVTVYDGPEAKLDIYTYQSGAADQVEVKTDGNLDPRLVQQAPQTYQGKHIAVHLKTGGSPSVEITTHPKKP